MGPPGAGKGTQAAMIAERCGGPAISTGGIFRAHVAAGTPLGRAARRAMEAGEYVPDDITNQLVRERLSEEDCADGFVLDGYPRTLEQVAWLDAFLETSGTQVDVVLALIVDQDELVSRLLARAATERRTDDTEDVIRRRQQLYAEETAALLESYDARGLLVRVDGSGSVQEVAERAFDALDIRA
ncbi:MAG TPA: adenylate kinase [Marmoricola sp.]|nr:adenylate kinase [Marmoricola sp.]